MQIARRIKERAVKRLGSHFKSRVRARLHQLGLLTPRPVERLILDLIASDNAATFLQIGVNDGQYADPLNLAVHRGYLRGAVVEPQPGFFAAVQRTYRGIPGMEFVQAAISDAPGTLPIYGFDLGDPAIPAWAHGSASLDKAQLMRFADRVPDLERRIVETPVSLITVPMLIDRIATKRPDIIVVDAEGHDARILRQFEWATLRPKLVLYENESMTPAEKREIGDALEHAGYLLRTLGQDTVAIRGDLRLAAN